MNFGKSFRTLKEARAFAKKQNEKWGAKVEVRKMSKRLHPRRKKLFHVGTWLDFLNFA